MICRLFIVFDIEMTWELAISEVPKLPYEDGNKITSFTAFMEKSIKEDIIFVGILLLLGILCCWQSK